ISPAERFDVIIDFSDFEGESFVLANNAKAPFPDGDDVIPPDVMLIKVNKPLRGRDSSRIPSTLNTVPPLDPATAVRMRDMVLSELESEADNPIMALLDNAHWDEPVTKDPTVGTTEIWRIINKTDDAHPIHVHLVQFQILDRQPFDVDQYPQNLVFTGPAAPPNVNERLAWKDTVISLPGTVTRIIARFLLPSGTQIRPQERFRYVFHCHILEHEENEMMRPYEVVGPQA
ncbi:MAG: multicopper oxidase domain-containing protein, partial [Blastocatellia bacterium]|nr:multicopper oxidase domain-containing protein [Blastocatellia bacterium]